MHKRRASPTCKRTPPCVTPKPQKEELPKFHKEAHCFDEIKHHYSILEKSKIGILSHVSSQHSVLDVLYGGDVGNPMPSWSIQTTPELEVTDQQHTGRCWIFATLAVLGHIFRCQYNISNRRSTFSEGYLGFWDLYEKSKLFLHVAYDTRCMSMDDPALSDLFKQGISDGGDFIFCMNLLRKYGLVPTEYYPNSSYGSMSTEALLTLINQLLRDDAIVLRRTGDKSLIPDMLTNIFTLLCMSLGTPPMPWKRLDWHLDQQETMPKLSLEIPIRPIGSVQQQQQSASVARVGAMTTERQILDGDGDDHDSDTHEVEVPPPPSRAPPEEQHSFNSLVAAIEASEDAGSVRVNSDDEGSVAELPTTSVVVRGEDMTQPSLGGGSEVSIVSSSPRRPEVEINMEQQDIASPRCGLKCPRKDKSVVSKCPAARSFGKMENPELQRFAHSVRSEKPVTEESLVFDFTPVEFYHRFLNGVRFIPLICDPRFSVGTRIIYNDANMHGGMPSLYLNVSKDDIEYYTIESLKRNIPVWFACDVKKQLTPEGGRMCGKTDRLKDLLPEKHEKGTKIEEICHYNAIANHALLISAVSLKNRRPTAWRIINSWGDVGRNAGVFVAYQEWFREHVYSVNAVYDTLTSQHKRDIDSNKKHQTVRLGPFDPSVI